MKESYEEDLANHFGLQRRGDGGNNVVLCVRVEGLAGQPLSSEIIPLACRPCPVMGKAKLPAPLLARRQRARRSLRSVSMRRHSNRENREIPSASQLFFNWERSANVPDGKADLHAEGKSDGSVVPTTTANKDAAEASAESDEGRDAAKRNASQAALLRTPGRDQRKSRGLHGVREAARKDSTLKFTALLHHVNEDCLKEAFFNLKKTAAVGVDGVTWYEYEQDVEERIADLHDRIHRGAYRAMPSRRAWIPKPDGRQRPLGIAALDDKIVQQAVLGLHKDSRPL